MSLSITIRGDDFNSKRHILLGILISICKRFNLDSSLVHINILVPRNGALACYSAHEALEQRLQNAGQV